MKTLRMLCALPMLLTLMACGTLKPDSPPAKTLLVNPMVTVEQSTCKSSPDVPANPVTNENYQSYLEGVRLAGEDCRSHLEALGKYLSNLP